MKQIQCPKCKSLVNINIGEAIDENGEIFRCKNCGFYIYVSH